jgi:hypothetical protein
MWSAAKASSAQYVVSETTYDYRPSQADGRHIFEGIEYLGGDALLAMPAGQVE